MTPQNDNQYRSKGFIRFKKKRILFSTRMHYIDQKWQ